LSATAQNERPVLKLPMFELEIFVELFFEKSKILISNIGNFKNGVSFLSKS
jgi:hypothetical protein